jgi:hypothetical protein
LSVEPPKITDCKTSSNSKINDAVIEGGKVALMCDISGSEPLYTSWTNETNEWNQKTLIFEAINRRNAGTYNIKVKSGEVCNKTAKANFTLNVYCKYSFHGCCMIVSVDHVSLLY